MFGVTHFIEIHYKQHGLRGIVVGEGLNFLSMTLCGVTTLVILISFQALPQILMVAIIDRLMESLIVQVRGT